MGILENPQGYGCICGGSARRDENSKFSVQKVGVPLTLKSKIGGNP